MPSTPRAIDAGVRIGEIFIDKYRVDAILGHGGMGVVALCTHLALNERVAIKMLRRDVLDDADAVERFMREAQAASRLKSEYVARVTDVGRSKTNVPYMVMEYLEGHDLGELLDERGTIAQRWAIELTLQACEALAEAHSLGIVHRDVKPSNLFVTWRPDGSALIKVLDFGISKALTGDAMQLTQTQSLLGTPAYMSPEQMRSARMVDARTDVWSLGTVLYEMLEGRRSFEAESFSEMCVKVAVDPPGAMPNTPPALQQVVLRCLAKQPEQRYGSMAELGRDLVPFSHDPHQAQVLAERMARTLRRSQVIEWEVALGETAVLRTPNPPLAVPQTPPPMTAASPLATTNLAIPIAQPPPASDPAILVRRVSDAAATASPLTQTYNIPRRRRLGVVVIVAAVAGAAAIGGVTLQRVLAPDGLPAAPASVAPAAPPPAAALPGAVKPAEPIRAADPGAAEGAPRAGELVPSVFDEPRPRDDVRRRQTNVPSNRTGKAAPPATKGNRTAPGKSPAAPDAKAADGVACDPFASPRAANACLPDRKAGPAREN